MHGARRMLLQTISVPYGGIDWLGRVKKSFFTVMVGRDLL